MDTLTHALSGALLARATWRKKQRLTLRERTMVGFLTAAFPDIDYILRLTTDDFLVYLNYHRGVTHSLILLPVSALILAWIFSHLLKSKPDVRSLFVICLLGVSIHIVGDVITSYGTMVLAPFTDWRATWDTTFIIDPIFTGIILVALIASYFYKKHQLVATAGLLTLVSYVCMQAWAQQRAVQHGIDASLRHAWRESDVSAIPQPLSPFHWKVIVEHKEHYHVGMLRLYGDDAVASKDAGFFERIYASYYSPETMEWVREDRYGYDRYEAERIKYAWNSEVMTDFRRFARFPVLVTDGPNPEHCHWFSDLRFMIAGRKNSHLFTYGVCSEPSAGTLQLKSLDEQAQ